MVFFDYTWDIVQLKPLAGIVKYGTCYDVDMIKQHLQTSLLWSSDAGFLKICKKEGLIRRYKEINIRHSDEELIKQGQEVHVVWDRYCLVQGYQDIKQFTLIDIEKPARGMEIGMMPAKLATMMVNMWLGLLAIPKEIQTVYDPFCGFGTTQMAANTLGHHAIGSDINISPCKINMKRRQDHKNPTLHATLFKQDVTALWTNPILRQVDVIVTEWRLGPVIRSFQQWEQRRQRILDEIFGIYMGFLKQYVAYYAGSVHPPIIMTLPVYSIDGSSVFEALQAFAETLDLDLVQVGDDYARKDQKVTRRVCRVTAKAKE